MTTKQTNTEYKNNYEYEWRKEFYQNIIKYERGRERLVAYVEKEYFEYIFAAKIQEYWKKYKNY